MRMRSVLVLSTFVVIGLTMIFSLTIVNVFVSVHLCIVSVTDVPLTHFILLVALLRSVFLSIV